MYYIKLKDSMDSVIESIAATVGDYRADDGIIINEEHVETWIRQFPKEDRQIILDEMHHILSNYYVSKKSAAGWIRSLLENKKLFNSGFDKEYKSVSFLNNQRKGSSQRELLSMLEEIIVDEYEIRLEDCGVVNPETFIYFDDCLFTGNTVYRDIEGVIDQLPKGAKLHLIFFAIYSSGSYYVERKLEPICKKNDIEFKVWRIHPFMNGKNASRLDVLRPLKVYNSTEVEDFIDEYISDEYREGIFRAKDYNFSDSLFTSKENRVIVERAFLEKGAYLLSLPETKQKNMRPLGYHTFQSLGFGSMFFTFRNCSNNTPVVLWWGNPLLDKSHPLGAWSPLFPRKVNN